MTEQQAISQLCGRVRALLVEAEMASRSERPYQIDPQSRLYRDLRESLHLVLCPKQPRDRAKPTVIDDQPTLSEIEEIEMFVDEAEQFSEDLRRQIDAAIRKREKLMSGN